MKTFLSLLALFFLFAYSNSLRVPQRSILKTNSQDVDRRSLPVSSTKLHSTSTATSVSMQPSVKKTASAFSNAIFQSAPLQYLLGSAALKTDMINFAKTIFSPQLFLFIFFQLSYSRNFKFAHRLQILAWTLLKLGTPLEFDKSILGFMSERAELLAKLMGFNYALTIACFCLSSLGVRVRGDFPVIFAKLTYVLYFTNFLDLFKAKFLYIFAPKLAESKRQSYVVNRAASVGIWTVGVLISCEMISTYLKIPLTSILAFGGVGGLAIGLSARDIVANFLGGMLLLFNEPFTPGDMITLKVNNMDITGRVERIGWGQIRLRGNTTRPTYIPNSHFVQVPVTNMDRITHRKFETRIPLRIQDFSLVPEITARIKDSLRAVPKLDVLSMPFRVSLVEVNQYSLGVEIMCYFATKSIDEFLGLQQTAYVEVMRAVESCGAQLALPPLGAYTAAMGANAYAYGVGGLPAMPTVASTQPRITPLPPPPPTVSTTAVTSVTAASLMATVAAMPLTSVVSAAALPTSPVNAPTAVSTVDVLPTPASVTRQAGATSTLSSVAVQAAPAPAPVSVSSIPGAMSGKAIASSGNPSTTRP